MPATIAATTVSEEGLTKSVELCFQRKTFYAAGRHWIFYIENIIHDGGPSWVYTSSIDGVIWDPYTFIRPGIIGSELSVAIEKFLEPEQDQFYVHYAWASQDGFSDVLYRRGLLDPSGEIFWDTDEQIAVPEQEGVFYLYPTIALDGAATPYIGYTHFYLVIGEGFPVVTHSTSSPIWTTDWEHLFPWPLVVDEQEWADSWIVVITSWNGNIFCVFTKEMHDIFCDYYDVDLQSWHGAMPSGYFMGVESEFISVTSIAAEKPWEQIANPMVHVAWQDSGDDILHFSYDIINGFSPSHLVYAGSNLLAPAITVMRYGEAGGNPHRTLYVFWTPKSPNPTPDYVCYKKSVNDGVTWTKEDGTAGVELWIDESADSISQINGLSVCPWTFADHEKGKTYLSFTYTRLGLSPDHVRFAGLEFIDPSENLAAGFSVRHLGSAIDLHGELDIRRTAIEDLKAGFNSQHPVRDLHGELDIRRTAIEDLKAGFNSQQPFRDLYGELNVRHSASRNLKGGFFRGALGDAELKGRFTVRHIETSGLLGEMIVRNLGISNLLSGVEIRHAAAGELLSGFIVRHSASVDLKGAFEASRANFIMQGVPVSVYRDIGVVS